MLFIVGINHKTAPLAIRERFSKDRVEEILTKDLLTLEGVQEVLVLFTCQRTEVYLELEAFEPLLLWWQQQFRLSDLATYFYWHKAYDAIRHCMQVSCGLDSMIIGESQILGQIKKAYMQALANKSIKCRLGRLFHHAIQVAKKIRHTTQVGACPVSLVSTLVRFAEDFFSSLEHKDVVLIGAGETIELSLKYLQSKPLTLHVFNRSYENALALIQPFTKVHAYPLQELGSFLKNADIVISATSSPLPIVTRALIEPRIKPLLCFDLGFPRDIDESITTLKHIYLYNLENLKKIIATHLDIRLQASVKAQQLIDHEASKLAHYLQDLPAPLVVYRHYVEALRDKALQQAISKIKKGADPEAVVTALATTLSNKFLHSPSVNIKRALEEGRYDVVEIIQEVWNLEKI
jgi:glutamyl-tRNA reductase